MRFYKFLPLLVFIYTNIIFANNYEQEYKIEVLIYKNNVIETQETFQSLLDLPKEDIIIMPYKFKSNIWKSLDIFIAYTK